MLSNILHTLFTRFLSAFINIAILIAISQFLGAQGKGWHSWWILNLTLTMILSNFIGGSALVYFSSRFSVRSILWPSYIWGITSAILTTLILSYFGKLESTYLFHFLLLSILETFFSIHLFIIQGQNQIRKMNYLQFLNLFVFLAVFIAVYLLEKKGIQSILVAFYISKIAIVCLSLFWVFAIIMNDHHKHSISTRKLFSFGLVLQIANAAQFLNYRFSFYMLESIDPTLSYLGIFSNSIAMAEGVWIVSKSISSVHYAEVSNSKNKTIALNNTLRLIRLTSIVAISLMAILFLFPSSFYTWLLGKDFSEVKLLFMILSPGVLFFSISGMITHYYAGIGINKYAMQAALIALLITLVTGVYLIPLYTLKGAALVNCLSYSLSTLYLIGVFKYKNNTPFSQFFIKKEDFFLLRQKAKEFIC